MAEEIAQQILAFNKPKDRPSKLQLVCVLQTGVTVSLQAPITNGAILWTVRYLPPQNHNNNSPPPPFDSFEISYSEEKMDCVCALVGGFISMRLQPAGSHNSDITFKSWGSVSSSGHANLIAQALRLLLTE